MISAPLRHLTLLVISTLLFALPAARAERQMEKLDRGVVAVRQTDGDCFISWRLLGTDPDGIAFNVYRSAPAGSPVKLNPSPLTGPTFFVDKGFQAGEGAEYLVRAVIGAVEQQADGSFTVPKNAPVGYLTVPLKTPTGYTPNDASVGDLDGDGQYEIVLHQTGRAHDNSHNGITDPPILQAYELDGTLLWEINLGKNIREGAHYTQFMVYDLDGDGKAEVACKTADGTVDGKGKVIGDAKADYVDEAGRILRGPEFLTVFDGLTGAELATTKYIPGRDPKTENPTGDQLKAIWGDGYGNRCDRFLACVAYLDGKHPSLVMCRGYYTRTVLAAWDWRNGKLTSRWVFDVPMGDKFASQGNHNLSVADVDGDGKDEIIYGGMCVDDDGKGLWTSELGHGDALHVSDLDPTHPGLEVFRIQEPVGDAGAHMLEAATGKVLWKKPTTAWGKKKEGPGRGVAFDVDPRHKGMECWVAGGGISGLFDAKGNTIDEKVPGACNFGVWWDGDFLREILDRNWIGKWDWKNSSTQRLLTAEGCDSNNGTKATPCLSGDILGDWREEVIWRTSDNNELRIYSTTIPTEHRLYTLMHDPQYRLSIAWQNVGYNQPPHTSFYLGADMKMPPRPDISTAAAGQPGAASNGRFQEAQEQLRQAIARRDARSSLRQQIKQLNKQPGALLVVKQADNAAELVRAKNALVQGKLTVADLGDGKRAVWQSEFVIARLPWFTAEELASGAVNLSELIDQYEKVAAANPEVRSAINPEIEKFKQLEREGQKTPGDDQ